MDRFMIIFAIITIAYGNVIKENLLEKRQPGDIIACNVRIVCDIPCLNGSVLDKNTCPTCTCIEPNCLRVFCDNICPNGYLKDKRGCQTCTCIPACKQPLCKNLCPDGRVLDEFGCPTCQCNIIKPLCGPVCSVFCKYGNVLDARGCKTCECKGAPA